MPKKEAVRQVALLRGVNVGGINLKMAEVAEVFRGLGLESVKTVLASGNVLFDSPRAPRTLVPEIEKGLRERFGYEAWVQVRPVTEIKRIIDAYPFPEQAGRHRYVVFAVSDEIVAELAAAAGGLDEQQEAVAAGDGVVYWTVERGSTLHSAFGKLTAKARFKASTTTRNLNTLEKLT